ncbi:MAG: EAL domain-containing protein [Candidatus Brocadiaceae bacterium]|nr:EAL domain-containing protein [Candidatus Brocadiaceae bacterium]
MRKFKLSLRNKALIGIIAILIPMLITFILVYSKNRIYLKNRALDTLTVIAEAYEGQVYQFLEKAKIRARDFARDGFIRTQMQKAIHGNTSAISKLNKHLVKNKLVLDKTINTINILSLEGRVVASTNNAEIGRDLSKEACFEEGKSAVTIVENRAGHIGLPEITISTPIFAKETGRPIGVIVNYILISEVNKLLIGEHIKELGAISSGKEKGAWKTMEIYLVNRDKLMITKSIFVEDAILKQVVDTLPVNLCLISSKEMAGFYKDYRGVEVVGASMYIPSMKWLLLVEIDRSEVLTPIRYVLINALITAAVVIVMVVLLFVVFIRKMVKPLRKISEAAKKIASGNFDVVVPVHAHDEIGVLCESFNYMAHHIKARITALTKSEARLAEAQRIAHIGNWEWDVIKNEVSWSSEAYRIFGLTQENCVVTVHPHLNLPPPPFSPSVRGTGGGIQGDNEYSPPLAGGVRGGSELIPFVSPFETFLNHVHSDDREFVKKSVDDALANKKPLDIDHRILLKDATIRTVHEMAVVTSDNMGKAVQMVGTVQDITGRKHAEEEVSLLKTLTLSISESKDLHDALVVTLEKVCSATGWVYGESWIPDPEGKCLVRDHAFYSRVDTLEKFSELSGKFTFTHGVGLPGRAWSAKHPVWLPDVTLDPNNLRASIAREAGLKAGVAFPVFSGNGNEIVAVLEFYMLEALERDERLVSFVSSVVIQLREVINRKKTEEIKTRLSEITETTTDSVVTATIDGRILYINKAGRKVIGIGENEDISNLSISDCHPKWASDLVLTKGIPNAIREGAWIGETAFLCRDGREIPISQVIIVHKNPDGTGMNLSTIGRDISERKRSEEQMMSVANRDPLTNLLNRRRFHEELEGWLAQTRRFGIKGALLFFDLDNFKYINDSLGHQAGDKFLITIADLLRARLRETDILARMGGDEFAIILPHADVSFAESVANQIRELVLYHTSVEGNYPPGITVSMGIAMFPDHGDTVETLLACADLAMYRAKGEGRNRVCVYTPEQKAQVESRLMWEKRIREALNRDGFVLFLQPIMDISQNLIIGHEALLRMINEKGEIVTPSSFLDIAERFGLIHDIDRWVVSRAIHLIKKFQHDGKSTHLEVNLSGRSFVDKQLLPLIRNELAATGIDPATLVFEITETALIENIAVAQLFIAELKSIGCRFALDDFGIGFSSFNYIRHLPVDYLKIDGRFIRNLPHDTVDQHLVKAMVEVACGLGKKTTAEFVENEETLRLLREYGVDYAQGYHVGKPRHMSEL